ncbi:hypothetical protein P7C73_g2266, partial [Tremellales sp. Uapishka_1]
MPSKIAQQADPPSGWPNSVVYLTKPVLSASFDRALLPLLSDSDRFCPHPVLFPPTLQIKRIALPSHPANGQNGLFAKKKLAGSELLIPYLGVIHFSLQTEDGSVGKDEHSNSDYDLSLLRLSSSDARNPFKGYHLSIGVDANKAGNAARFVNDYRGVRPVGPNAEFKLGRGAGGELRMEIWSLKDGIGKGDEVVVSYGKGWWGARNPGQGN